MTGADNAAGHTSPEDITRTTRDPEVLRAALEAWLGEHLPGVRVSQLDTPGNGMSSETVLFDATSEDGTVEQLVARIAPPDDAVPVFDHYDLAAQFHLLRLVANHSTVPVPTTRWLCTDTSVLGGEFFVLDRAHGSVPPDVMPYTMDGFVLDATPADRRRLQDAAVDVLADLHSIDPERVDLSGTGLHIDRSATALRRHVDAWHRYANWVRRGRTIPLLDDAERWLEAHWPGEADARAPVISWGDARIGNIMFERFAPTAVLDWEMADIGPRELDVGWMTFMHTFFQDITVELGLAGLPDMLRLDDVVARYESTSGIALYDMAWFVTFAAYRHAALMVRLNDRRVHFGEAEPSDDPHAGVFHAARLRALLT